MAARISVRKMGTRKGEPHYGAECMTCGTVLIVAHVTKIYAQAVGLTHRTEGCRLTLRYSLNAAKDKAHLRAAS